MPSRINRRCSHVRLRRRVTDPQGAFKFGNRLPALGTGTFVVVHRPIDAIAIRNGKGSRTIGDHPTKRSLLSAVGVGQNDVFRCRTCQVVTGQYGGRVGRNGSAELNQGVGRTGDHRRFRQVLGVHLCGVNPAYLENFDSGMPGLKTVVYENRIPVVGLLGCGTPDLRSEGFH